LFFAFFASFARDKKVSRKGRRGRKEEKFNKINLLFAFLLSLRLLRPGLKQMREIKTVYLPARNKTGLSSSCKRSSKIV